jgi:enoyl-CoA hydratase/carnithine racemase
VQVVWEEIAGTARAKWLLWTGQTIDAHTALEGGVVSEVVPHDRAVERAAEADAKSQPSAQDHHGRAHRHGAGRHDSGDQPYQIQD